jgi:hypothetical protein
MNRHGSKIVLWRNVKVAEIDYEPEQIRAAAHPRHFRHDPHGERRRVHLSGFGFGSSIREFRFTFDLHLLSFRIQGDPDRAAAANDQSINMSRNSSPNEDGGYRPIRVTKQAKAILWM